MKAIEVSCLSKCYANGVEALKELDLTVEEGEFFGLIGANGAGKSTLIGVLTGLIVKSSGRVELFGYDIDEKSAEARLLIGFVPQESNFNLFDRVEELLYNQAGYYGIGRRTAKASVEELLERLELSSKRGEEVRHLSGGMRRRLMIARALVHHPSLLLLDEPTVGLDVTLRHAMWDYLEELSDEGVTILLTSHYLEEVEHLCKRAALIEQGRVIHVGEMEQLVSSLEMQVYIAKLSHSEGLEQLQGFAFQSIGHNELEVTIGHEGELTDFITALHHFGICVNDLRPKTNRLEQLFLNKGKGLKVKDSRTTTKRTKRT